MTTRKPATPGEILVEAFLAPMDLTQGALAASMQPPGFLAERAAPRRFV